MYEKIILPEIPIYLLEKEKVCHSGDITKTKVRGSCYLFTNGPGGCFLVVYMSGSRGAHDVFMNDMHDIRSQFFAEPFFFL